MYELTISDSTGNALTFEMGSPYQIDEIEGFSPPDADINLTTLALLDGSKFNSAKVQSRVLNIAFAVERNAEKNRIAAYKVLRIKKPVTVTYKSEYRNVWIEGYISSINVSHYAMKQEFTVSIVCPEPYFKAAEEIVNSLSVIAKSFYFPFYGTADNNILFGYRELVSNTILVNGGETETGIVITIDFSGSVSFPRILDYYTGDYFGVDYSFISGDTLTIDTRAGKKTVYLWRNGTNINLFNYIEAGSTWFVLPVGETVLTYEVGTGSAEDVLISISHYDLFEGV